MGMGTHTDGQPAGFGSGSVYDLEAAGEFFCQNSAPGQQVAPWQCTGDSTGVRAQAQNACAYYKAGATAEIDGEVIPKTFGHYLDGNDTCGQCYIVKTSPGGDAPAGKKVIVMGIDGWGAVAKNNKVGSCSPEMGHADCGAHLGSASSCIARVPFTYKRVDCPM